MKFQKSKQIIPFLIIMIWGLAANSQPPSLLAEENSYLMELKDAFHIQESNIDNNYSFYANLESKTFQVKRKQGAFKGFMITCEKDETIYVFYISQESKINKAIKKFKSIIKN